MLEKISHFSNKISIKLNLKKHKSLYKYDSNEIKFEYSEDWYNKVYHLGRVGVDRRSFKDVNAQYERAGYRKRLDTVLNSINIEDDQIHWLEIGCHLGLTSFWIISRYPKVHIHMLDFSEESIVWCNRHFPLRDRAVIWQCDAGCIRLGDNDLAEYFNIVTCIDVTEHLPNDVYKNMIAEIWRVLKPKGYLILMQGNSPLPEHIHILPEKTLVDDFIKQGFKLIKNLPYRHYLFEK